MQGSGLPLGTPTVRATVAVLVFPGIFQQSEVKLEEACFKLSSRRDLVCLIPC